MRLTAPKKDSKTVRGNKTALVVDDIEDMLDLLEIALNCADFSVLRATSVADALELFGDHEDEIDLLMTEVRVGAENGLDLAKRLRQTKPSLQVLAISGVARDRKAVFSEKGFAFLSKPFSASELRRQLECLFPA